MTSELHIWDLGCDGSIDPEILVQSLMECKNHKSINWVCKKYPGIKHSQVRWRVIYKQQIWVILFAKRCSETDFQPE
jgi:hypothetical protein